MCGIAGGVRFEGLDASLDIALQTAATIRCRGPDASGQVADGPAAFAHGRPSIRSTTTWNCATNWGPVVVHSGRRRTPRSTT
jgi:asparagine synthetase B (glutamine-hydrolysing)